jgi:UDP-N-acetylmuramoyl-tripeptide--D-alanyl-D-alanine ligase
MKDRGRGGVTLVGTGGVSDFEATDIEEVPTGISFRADGTRFVIPLHGTHNVSNALLAIAVARHLGMSLQAIAKRLLTFAPPSRTFQVRREHGVTILDDTHNSSAASFKAAIAWARNQPFSQKTLISSGLIELGEEQERTHMELGGVAAPVFQRAIFLNARSGHEFAEGFGKPVEVFSKKTRHVPSGSLLVCVGRMAAKTIERLLP